MTIENRIKCAASIDVYGGLSLGAALPGFRNTALPNETYYLLEDTTTGQWEIRYRNAFGADSSTDTSSGGAAVFLGGTAWAGLTLSQVTQAVHLWDTRRGNATNGTNMSGAALGGVIGAEIDNAIAIGPQATPTFNAVAVGTSTQASGGGAVAVGHWARAPLPHSTAVGSQRAAHPVSFPVSAYLSASATVTVGDSNAAAINLNTLFSNATAGVLAVTAVLDIRDVGAGSSTAGRKVVKLDYAVWLNSYTGVLEVLGAPTVTAMFTGASAPTSAVGVSADGLPTVGLWAAGGSVVGYLQCVNFCAR